MRANGLVLAICCCLSAANAYDIQVPGPTSVGTPLPPTLKMRRLAKAPFGPSGERIVCCDSDHDSMPELIFNTGSIRDWDPLRIEVWEHQGWNRFKLVYADTGAYPEPLGITTGNAIPFAAGDIDGDGLTDLVCVTWEPDSTDPDKAYNDVITVESPDSFSYPSRLSWYYRCANNYAWSGPAFFMRCQGARAAIISSTPIGTCIWENVGNDQNQLAWQGSLGGGHFAFRDFDRDGKEDIGTGWSRAEAWECAGDYQYERVWRDTLGQGNGDDVFSTNDIDGDGRPEFYDSFEWHGTYLYMYENCPMREHVFTRTLVGAWSGSCSGSAGGDLDGDGVDECIWTTLAGIRIYKAAGDDDLRKVWEWGNDHIRNQPASTVYDVNGDGYNELLFAGTFETSIFEVDAVDLLSPNHGTYSVGDTVPIRWKTNRPPRCDSLSLLLRRDSSWNLKTIARGLPASDTMYRWVVPASVPDTGRVVVIAYGPGWQFDMSDSAVTFIGGGVAEGTRNIPLRWSLSVSPNPARGAFAVRYDVPTQTRVSVGLYDVDGRLVRSLTDGEAPPGRYDTRLPSGILPAGVYFLCLDASGSRSVNKVVVAR
jgi:hypothetical protein